MREYEKPTRLLDLPPEILFDILAYSGSSDLPQANKYLYYTFKQSSASTRAQFILQRHRTEKRPINLKSIIQTALAYPICTISTLDILERLCPPDTDRGSISATPGAWLFRHLHTRAKLRRRKSERLQSAALLFLEELDKRYSLSFPERTSGFALAMCVRAGAAQYPLLRFLLRAGADPAASGCLALRVAATAGSLEAMKILVERDDGGGSVGRGKRRRVEDRVQPTVKMLTDAVKGGHTKLALWLMNEKGVTPDMATVRMMSDAV